MKSNLDSFKLLDFSSNERPKARLIKGKKYETFINENEQARTTSKVSFKELLKYYYLYPKNSLAPFKLPFLKPNLSNFDTPHITWG